MFIAFLLTSTNPVSIFNLQWGSNTEYVRYSNGYNQSIGEGFRNQMEFEFTNICLIFRSTEWSHEYRTNIYLEIVYSNFIPPL